MTEERKRDLVRAPALSAEDRRRDDLVRQVSRLVPQETAPSGDDGHPDARVQQALDALDEALADWSYDRGLPGRAYFLLLATKDADGSGFRSVSRHEMTVEQAVAVEKS